MISVMILFLFFKQQMAYEMRISDWSSDVCSSDLGAGMTAARKTALVVAPGRGTYGKAELGSIARLHGARFADRIADFDAQRRARGQPTVTDLAGAERFSIKVHMRGDVAAPLIYTATALRSEEHTSERQHIMCNSYAVLRL